MGPSVQNGTAQTTVKGRRLIVQRCLAEFGLSRGSWRAARLVEKCDAEQSPERRLRAALAVLGPVFASFGLYLSSRVDLLSARACRALSSLPDRAAETTPAAVRERIIRELGAPPEEVYGHFEDTPFESRLLAQSHHAWHADGTALVVKVMHPSIEEQLQQDVELLPLLESAFAAIGCVERALQEATTDFRHTMEQRTNFCHEADALEALAYDARGFEMLATPHVDRQRSTARVLTLQRLAGMTLAEVVSTGEDSQCWPDLGRCLWTVWLRQALLGQLFPVDPAAEDVLLLPTRQIAFSGGTFACLGISLRKNLQDYLLAAAAGDVDRACVCLLREMDTAGATLGNELRQHIRQAIPAREGLDEQLFSHWRLAYVLGCRPIVPLMRFYRGAHLISSLVGNLAGGRDALREGLEDVRLLAILSQMKNVLSFRFLNESLEQYGSLLLELPRCMDEALTRAAEDGGRMPLDRNSDCRRRNDSTAVFIALLFVLAAVGLATPRLAGILGVREWVDGLGAAFFLAVGWCLLQATARGH